MKISNTEKRKKLQELIKTNYTERINSLGGITLLEKRDSSVPGDCEYYVFWEIKQEFPFTVPSAFLDLNLAFDVMERRGYSVVQSPQDGDVVAYILKRARIVPYISHLGVFDKDKVTSRFGSGSVYRHDVNMVPAEYGNKVIFFRKQEKQAG